MNHTNPLRHRGIAAALVGLLLVASPVGAHGDHSHAPPASKQDIELQSDAVRQQLLREGRLDDSWKTVPVVSSTLRDTDYGEMWVVKYSNPDASDLEKRELFVFIDPFGSVISANHSGKLGE